MKFRTEIEIDRWSRTIGYDDNILTLGSCFANNIAERLFKRRFRVVASPTGILFNPASVERAIRAMLSPMAIDKESLVYQDGRYLSYDFHSAISGQSPAEAASAMEHALRLGGEAIRSADHIIITLGTAWVYRLKASGEVVANCHKQPHRLFDRELLSVDECVALLESIIGAIPSTTQLILTLSPVRHIGDGMEENSLSKAVLRVAIDKICRQHNEVVYFPSYEIMMDDLRDYRFYAEDMVHPSSVAVDYIATKFFDASLSEQAKRLMPKAMAIVQAAQHRPLNSQSAEYKNFCQRQLQSIDELKEIDFTEEKSYFERMLQINL